MCAEKLNNCYKELGDLLESAFKSEDDEDKKIKEFCNRIALEAKKVTEASFALLYLTADHKILEAVGCSGEPVQVLDPPQIPFYRLDWDNAPGYENTYDGFTAWATLHIKEGDAGNLKWEDLKLHPAHKGQWDPLVWKGAAEKLLCAIMFAPIAKSETKPDTKTETKTKSEECSYFGLLKVELSVMDAKNNSGFRIHVPFTDKQQKDFKRLAKWVCDKLSGLDCEKRRVLQKWLTKHSARQKAEHLMVVLRNWRSAEYNITEAMGYLLEFFRMLIGADSGIHILLGYEPWRKPGTTGGQPNRIYVMPYWRPCFQERSFKPQGRLKGIERNKIPRPAFRCKTPENFKDGRDLLTFLESDQALAKVFINSLLQDSGTEDVCIVAPNMRILVQQTKQDGPVQRTQDKSITISFEKLKAGQKQEPGCIDIRKALIIKLRASRSDFGMIVLPLDAFLENKISSKLRKGKEFTNELVGYAVSLARVLDRILGSEFGIQPGTCLPIHRPAGVRKLVIGFADIRNFTTVTRILRLMGTDKLAAVEVFMEHYCRVMARIANEWGRLDKFMGDGIMALFGEDLLPIGMSINPDEAKERMTKTVLTAVCFAMAAVRAFEELTKIWLDDKLLAESLPWRVPIKVAKPLLRNIKTEHCEDIQLDIGIALNFGSVHMDYFGDTRRRDYSAIGDNVNLCARLCDEAGRYDCGINRQRAPILVTQTVLEYLHAYLTSEAQNRMPLRLQLRSMGVEYPVYELWHKDVEYTKVSKCFGGTRYEDVFERTFDLRNGELRLKKEYIESLSLQE